MGRVKGKVLTQGFSGKFGDDLVFRQVGNKTFFARKGVNKKSPTADQVSMRNKFADAVYFASAALGNAALMEEYTYIAQAQKLKSAYVAAITDYLTAPEIGKVVTVMYTGKVGDAIDIWPKTAYKITDLDVTIISRDGKVLESGQAIGHFQKYRYVASVTNQSLAGTRIVLRARDRQRREQITEVLV